MTKKLIQISILLSSFISAENTLFEVLNKSEIANNTLILVQDVFSENKKTDMALELQNNTQTLLNSTKWKLHTSITHHINPMFNNIKNNHCIDCGLDKALGVIGQIQYHSTETFAIGLKATILNDQYENSIEKESVFNNVRLNNLSVVCILTL